MKKIFFIFLITSCIMGFKTCFGQITFEKSFSLSGYDMQGKKVIQNNDKSFLILANAYLSILNGTGSGCLVKTDSIGNVLWAKLYSDLLFDYIMFTNFEQTPDGSYLISGYARHGYSRLLMLKVDSSGNIIWCNCYGQGSSTLNMGNSIKVLSDGNYLVCGSVGNAQGDFYILKTDTSGNTLWSRSLGTFGYEAAIDLEITANGNFVVMGCEDTFGTTLVEFDNSGNMIWNKTYSLPFSNLYGLQQTAISKCPDNGFAIVGNWFSDTSSVWWPYLLKTDSSGNAMWCKIYTTAAPGIVGEFFDIRVTADSGFILTWEPEYPCHYCRTGMIKTDSLGDIEWARNFILNVYNFPSSAIQTLDLEYAVVGYVRISNVIGVSILNTDNNGETGCYDSALVVVPVTVPVAINTYGILGSGHFLNTINPFVTSVSLVEMDNCVPVSLNELVEKNQISEINVFPNPAYKNVSINAHGFKEGKVEIKIIDMLGQILLFEKVTTTNGGFSINLDIGQMNSGIYFVCVTIGTNPMVRKLIVE